MRFENLSMLWAFAALSLPVLIHFLWKRRYETYAFGAMTVLRRALARRKDRLLWEQVLMIATRVLLLAALATALLHPAIGMRASESRPATCLVLLFDNSYSMLAGEGLSRLERARFIAQHLMDSVEPQDEVFIASAAGVEDIAGLHPYRGGDDAKAAVQALPVAWKPSDLCAALREAGALFRRSRCERRELFVFTDNQALSYGALDHPRWPAVAKEIRGLNPAPRVFWVEPGNGEAWTERNKNLIVDPPTATATVVHAGQPFALYVGVRNSSARDLAQADVVFEADGQLVARQTLRLPAGGDATARFSYRPRQPGPLRLCFTVRADGDVLAADDTVLFAARAEAPPRVLLVDGNLTPEPLHNESDLLRLALAPPAGDGTAPYQVDVVSPAELHRLAHLQRYAAIAFLNVREPHEAIVNRLEQYVASGGGLLLALGDRCERAHYNRILHRDGRGLLPCRLLSKGGDEADPEHYEAPRIADSRASALATLGRAEADFANVRVRAWHKVQVPDFQGLTSAPIALVPSGDALVLERPFGRGLLYVVTTGLNTAWTDFPIHPSYQLLMRGLIDSLRAARLPQVNLQVGEPVEGSFAGDERGAEHRVQAPDRQPVKLAIRRRFGSDRVHFGDTNAPGLYTLVSDKEGRSRQTYYAVNLETRESDLCPADPRAQAAVLAALGARRVRDWEDLQGLFKRARRGLELWWLFLVLAAGFGLLEIFLGKWFTRSFVDEAKLSRGSA